MQFGPFQEFTVGGGIPPSPSIYWNHNVRGKFRRYLLKSIACRQNLENKTVPILLREWSRSLLLAMIGGRGCGWQGYMSQPLPSLLSFTTQSFHHRDTEAQRKPVLSLSLLLGVSVVIRANVESFGGKIKVKVKGSGQGRPLYTCLLQTRSTLAFSWGGV
jgi:hypothetical protein